MDSSHFLVRQATDITEYRAGGKIRMRGRTGDAKKDKIEREELDENNNPLGDGITIDLEEKCITGEPAKMHGASERPWFNWEAGIAGCGCTIFLRGEVLFCRHILGLFESLNDDENQYGELFLQKFMNDPMYVSSVKTKSKSVSTGLDSVDELLGGGWPRSAITAVGGTTKVGKTFMSFQSAYNTVMNGMNVLWFDCENMLKRKDAFEKLESIFSRRYDYKESVISRIHIISDSTLEGIGKYFGLDLSVSTAANKLKVYRTIRQKKTETPIVQLCKAKKIDLVVLDSLTNLIKPYIGDTQDLGARRLIIDSLWEPMEALATECDLAFICINHATRSYDWKLYDTDDGPGILDNPVDDSNAGLWGASALMYHVKHFVQLENCTKTHCKKKNIKHFMRRLFPFQASAHVDLEMIRDYGFVEY